MEAKEKAKELVLVHQMKQYGVNKFVATRAALITVNNILSSNPHSNPFNTVVHSTMGYWLEVKKEIEMLK